MVVKNSKYCLLLASNLRTFAIKSLKKLGTNWCRSVSAVFVAVGNKSRNFAGISDTHVAETTMVAYACREFCKSELKLGTHHVQAAVRHEINIWAAGAIYVAPLGQGRNALYLPDCEPLLC